MKTIITILVIVIFASFINNINAQTKTTSNKVISNAIDKKQFSGNYSFNNKETGEYLLIEVSIVKNKLLLDYRVGGTMTFGYNEKSLKETIKDKEYILNTIDLDGNGAYLFKFQRNNINEKYKLKLKSLDDPSQEEFVFIFDK
jgi:hypothetical protein